MKNCLVKTYKMATNNDSLPIFRNLRITFPKDIDYNDSMAQIKWAEGEEPESARWLNGSSIPITINDLTRQVTVTTKYANDDTLLFQDKSIITDLILMWGNGKVAIEDLSGTSITNLQFGHGNDGDSLDMIPDSILPNLERIYVAGLTGNISLFSVCSELIYLLCNTGSGATAVESNVIGSLSSISNLAKLQIIIVPRGVTGNLSQLNCGDTLINFSGENNSNTYADNDASLWANKFKTLQIITSWNSRLVWNSTSLRSSAYPVINAQVGFASATDCDNFLINMATCLDNGLYTQTNKNMYFQGGATRTSASDAAVNKFVAAGWTINGVTKV